MGYKGSHYEGVKSVSEIVTERFLAQLAEGIVPWRKPWLSLEGVRCGCWSHNKRSNGKPYSLLNQLMLPKEGEYVTFKEANAEGGSIRKGAKSYPIFFWGKRTVTTRDPDTNIEEEKEVPILRYYRVFHISDCIGVTQNYKPDLSPLEGMREPSRCAVAEKCIKTYLKANAPLKLVNEAQNQAYYSPMEDVIKLPLKKQFKSAGEYYSTLFHEAVHSTGHESRLSRLGSGVSMKGRATYSLEELVAEIGAASMMFHFNLEDNSTVDNSNAYLKSWYEALQNDKQMIVKACSRAERAVRYIFGEDVKPHGDYARERAKKIPDKTYQEVIPDFS